MSDLPGLTWKCRPATPSTHVRIKAVLVELFKKNSFTCSGKIRDVFLSGENIYKLLDQQLSKFSIPWKNVVSFCCDNASVMMGIHKGVAKYIKEKNPSTFINGCACHLLHLAAKAGSKELRKDVEFALIEIYAYLDKSTKRKKEFMAFQKECGVKLNKILKHGATRWLSLEACINRLIEQSQPLQSFFQTEFDALTDNQKKSQKSDRLRRITKFLNDDVSKLYCFFLQDIMPVFNHCNLALQRDAPQIHQLQIRFHELFTDLLIRFVKTSAISKCSNIFSIEHSDKKNQVCRSELKIGSKARELLTQLKKDEKISIHDEDGFVTGMFTFQTLLFFTFIV